MAGKKTRQQARDEISSATPKRTVPRKHPAAATVILLMLTYDISFDDSVPGSPHHPETILYARVIASGRQCP
jgi:hypothetical protein